MLITKPRFNTFEEYLEYEDDSEQLYELFNGELIAMPPESGLNVQIATRLLFIFASLLGTDRVRGQGLELEVRGEPRNRYPDLTIIREEHIQQLTRRNTLRLDMLPPILVVEIVSPGDIQRHRDYIAKRQQYQDCGIPEYWIVDPHTQKILILELQNSFYQEVGTFSQNDRLPSPNFPEFNLTAAEVLGHPFT